MSLIKDGPTLKPIDRQKVCPFLLKMFLCDGRHHTMQDYTNKKTPPVATELQIYTWPDATLNELMALIRRHLPAYQSKGTQFSFSVVYPDSNSPNYKMRHVGFTISGKRGPDDEKTLAQCKLQIGDYIDVGILPMGADITKLNSNQGMGKRRKRGGGAGGGGSGPPGRFYRP